MYIYTWETTFDHGVVIADDELDARNKVYLWMQQDQGILMDEIDLFLLGNVHDEVFSTTNLI